MTERFIVTTGHRRHRLRARRTRIAGGGSGPVGLQEAAGVVNADEVDAFSRVGTFKVFLDGKYSKPILIPFGTSGYQIWCFRDEKKLVVKQTSLAKGKQSSVWSQFSMKKARRPRRKVLGEYRAEAKRFANNLGDWRSTSNHRGALSVGKFSDLLVQCPEFGTAVRKGFYGVTNVKRT